jgi:protein tyrosine/serine phosphatase
MIQPDNVHDVLRTDIRTPIPDAIVSKIISQPPFVNVPGVSNIRDLGNNNKLRRGFVYRSGNVADILDAGKAVLIDELKITTIFDLRNQSERERVPSPEIEGIETIWMPYGTRPASLNLKDFAGEDQGDTGFVKMYTGILDAAKPAFTEIFRHIRDQPNDPFVFHCSGKYIPELGSYLRCRSHIDIV